MELAPEPARQKFWRLCSALCTVLGEDVGSTAHSEGESLSEGEKKRLGRRGHPQNGDIGGSVAGREHSEDHLVTSQIFR